jgi:cytochrome subunit of sulfide dehydrogenase
MRIWFPVGLVLMSVTLPVPATEVDSHLRVLAASCAACHGSNGNSVGGTPVLAGLDRSHFILQMQSFRDGSRSSSVMHHHAKGLNPQEIEQLAEHFSLERRAASNAPIPLGGL